MAINNLFILIFIALAGAGLLALTQRVKKGNKVGLRPHSGYTNLKKQVGYSVESGQHMHISLGRGNLTGSANPTSVAALIILDHLAESSCASGMPPVVTTGDGTLLVAGQDKLRQVYNKAHRATEFKPGMIEFQAGDTYPLAYAAGVTHALNREAVGSNILAGRFGSEIALITEAAERAQAEQLISSDDPIALALAYPLADALIIGEEHLAAGAYLQGKPAQLASLQLQDFLRLFAAIAIILATFFAFITGLTG